MICYFYYQKDSRDQWRPRGSSGKPPKVKDGYPIRGPVHPVKPEYSDLTLYELAEIYPAPE